MNKETTKKIIASILLVLIVIGSVTLGTDFTTDPKLYESTISSLDEKKATVMALTASSAAASTAIAAIPGDASTPIANKIADLSSSLLIILCAIYLEKALITLTGYASCGLLIPAACMLIGIHLWVNKPQFKVLAQKLLIFGIMIMLIIPVGVKVGDIVYATYDSTIQNAIETMNESNGESESVMLEETTENAAPVGNNTENTEDTSGIKDWLSGIKDKVSDTANDVAEGIGNAVSSVGQGVSDVLSKGKTLLNCFIDSIAMLIISSCLVPVAILMFFMWLTKAIFGMNIDTQSVYAKIGNGKKKISGKVVSAGASAGKKIFKKSNESKTKLLEK